MDQLHVSVSEPLHYLWNKAEHYLEQFNLPDAAKCLHAALSLHKLPSEFELTTRVRLGHIFLFYGPVSQAIEDLEYAFLLLQEHNHSVHTYVVVNLLSKAYKSRFFSNPTSSYPPLPLDFLTKILMDPLTDPNVHLHVLLLTLDLVADITTSKVYKLFLPIHITAFDALKTKLWALFLSRFDSSSSIPPSILVVGQKFLLSSIELFADSSQWLSMSPFVTVNMDFAQYLHCYIWSIDLKLTRGNLLCDQEFHSFKSIIGKVSEYKTKNSGFLIKFNNIITDLTFFKFLQILDIYNILFKFHCNHDLAFVSTDIEPNVPWLSKPHASVFNSEVLFEVKSFYILKFWKSLLSMTHLTEDNWNHLSQIYSLCEEFNLYTLFPSFSCMFFSKLWSLLLVSFKSNTAESSTCMTLAIKLLSWSQKTHLSPNLLRTFTNYSTVLSRITFDFDEKQIIEMVENYIVEDVHSTDYWEMVLALVTVIINNLKSNQNTSHYLQKLKSLLKVDYGHNTTIWQHLMVEINQQEPISGKKPSWITDKVKESTLFRVLYNQ
ncbi:hypothetical protein GEMRC1_009383 [Eukaryota sp. GEM-RC1]